MKQLLRNYLFASLCLVATVLASAPAIACSDDGQIGQRDHHLLRVETRYWQGNSLQLAIHTRDLLTLVLPRGALGEWHLEIVQPVPRTIRELSNQEFSRALASKRLSTKTIDRFGLDSFSRQDLPSFRFGLLRSGEAKLQLKYSKEKTEYQLFLKIEDGPVGRNKSVPPPTSGDDQERPAC